MNTECFFSVRWLALYPINQNLFSINFLLLCARPLSLIFLVDRICIFFNGKNLLCALLGWQAVVFWFMITISDFGRGCERQGHFRNDIGRPARGDGERRKRATNAPQVRKNNSAITTEFPELRSVLAMNHTLIRCLFSRSKAKHYYWQRGEFIGRKIFHFFAAFHSASAARREMLLMGRDFLF